MPKRVESHTRHNGELLIYRRQGSPRYYARIWLPAEQRSLERSLKTDVLAIADQRAADLWAEIRFRTQRGEKIMAPTLGELLKDYHAECAKGVFSRSMHVRNTSVIKHWLGPYFDAKRLSDLSPHEGERYTRWRLSKGAAPSKATLSGELILANQLLTWVEGRGLATGLPRLATPRQLALAEGRRTYFRLDEIGPLFELVARESHGEIGEGLRHLVPLLYYSGVRTNDISLMRFRDLQSYDHQGKPHIRLFSRGKASAANPPKWVVVHPDADPWVVSWIMRMGEGEPDRLLWAVNGRVPDHQEAFNRILKRGGMLLDADGQSRSLYSLRHSYATHRLLSGVTIQALAGNMRTSIQMIERHYGHVVNMQRTDELTAPFPV